MWFMTPVLRAGEPEEGREFEITEIIIKINSFKELRWKSVETWRQMQGDGDGVRRGGP